MSVLAIMLQESAKCKLNLYSSLTFFPFRIIIIFGADKYIKQFTAAVAAATAGGGATVIVVLFPCGCIGSFPFGCQ